MDNCVIVTKQMLRSLGVKHTKIYLKDQILSHPNHPSLLSIADTLNEYHIDHIEVKINKDRFDELIPPCIVQLEAKGMTSFYVIKKIYSGTVQYYDENGKKKILAKDNIIKSWTGVSLLAEKTSRTKEPGIEQAVSKKKVTIALAVVFGSLFIFGLILSALESESNKLTVIIYALLKISGLMVGALLLWFEVDQYNPTLQSFCSGGEKINCNSVLKSKYASLFNGQLSVSSLGFAYFFGTLSFLIIYGFDSFAIILVGYSSLATIPIITISVIYQALVIKQWCKFCILIQGVLMAEVALVLLNGLSQNFINILTIPILIALLILPLLIWHILKPLLEQQKETLVYKRGLNKIKNNSDVLKGLLLNSEKIKTNPEGLGISFTNKDAKYNIIKVCNPYCGPCAKAHTPLEELFNKGTINLQMIYTATPDEKDYKALPVRHFLAIDSRNNKKKTQKALDEWYLNEQKDYKIFAKKYPMNGELSQQKEKIQAMSAWCITERITHTPTVFINGHQLPKEYSIEDLNDVLK